MKRRDFLKLVGVGLSALVSGCWLTGPAKGDDIKHIFIPYVGKELKYPLWDEFMLDRAVRAINGTSAEPGPGLRNTVDTQGKLSITSLAIQMAGGKAKAAWGDPAIYEKNNDGTYFTRVPGLEFESSINLSAPSSMGCWLGWFSTTNLSAMGALDVVWVRSVALDVYSNGNVAINTVGAAPIPGQTYTLRSILRAAGAFHFAEGGVFTRKLLFVTAENATTLLRPALVNYSNVGYSKNWKIQQRSGAIASKYGFAIDFKATPQAGNTLVGWADGIVEFTWTPAANDLMELSFRRTDDNNRWVIRCDQAGSTFKGIVVKAGVETEKVSASQTWTIGTPYRIVATMDGKNIFMYIGNVNSSGQQISIVNTELFNMNATGVKVSHAGTDLIAWPLHATADYAGGEKPKLFVFDGNRITLGSYASAGKTYPEQFIGSYQQPATLVNFGAAGKTWGDMEYNATAQVDPLYSASAYSDCIYIGFEGTSDIANAYHYSVIACNNRRAAGFKVIVMSTLPWGTQTLDETRRQAARTQYLNDFNMPSGIDNIWLPASGTTYADLFIDIGNDPTIGVAGSQNNGTYYRATDLTSPLDPCYAIIADKVASGIGLIVPGGVRTLPSVIPFNIDRTALPAGVVSRFVWITDVHATPYPYPHGSIGESMAYINGMNPDFVIDSGDCTDNGLSSEFAAYLAGMSSLTKTKYTVPGNHDVGSPAYQEYDAAGLGRHFSVVTGPFKIIGFTSNAVGKYAEITQTELDYINAELATADGKTIILITHHPSGLILTIPGYPDITEFLTDKGIKNFWAGHTHLGCYSGLINRGATKQVIGGSLKDNGVIGNLNLYGGINICNVYSDRIEIDYCSGRHPFQSWGPTDYPAYATKIMIYA